MKVRAGWLSVAALLVGGCGLRESGGVRPLSMTPRSYATSADWRLVFERRSTRAGDGTEKIITCAEPSPDIAKIAAQTASGGFTGSAKGLAKVQPEVALTVALARSEAMAQLGKRLATVQLLRDALYRACEAYANDAISPASYAMIVSRYDDVMVTLLLGELAAESGSNSAASLSSSASLGALPPAEAAATLQEARIQAERARAAVTAAEGEVKAAEALKADVTTRDADIKAARIRLEEARVLRAAKEQLFEQVVGKLGGGIISAISGAGAPGTARSSVSADLAAMQAAYLKDFNLDAIMVGCLSTLSRLDVGRGEAAQVPVPSAAGSSNLQDECRAVLDRGATLRLISYARALQLGGGEEAGADERAQAILQRLEAVAASRPDR